MKGFLVALFLLFPASAAMAGESFDICWYVFFNLRGQYSDDDCNKMQRLGVTSERVESLMEVARELAPNQFRRVDTFSLLRYYQLGGTAATLRQILLAGRQASAVQQDRERNLFRRLEMVNSFLLGGGNGEQAAALVQAFGDWHRFNQASEFMTSFLNRAAEKHAASVTYSYSENFDINPYRHNGVALLLQFIRLRLPQNGWLLDSLLRSSIEVPDKALFAFKVVTVPSQAINYLSRLYEIRRTELILGFADYLGDLAKNDLISYLYCIERNDYTCNTIRIPLAYWNAGVNFLRRTQSAVAEKTSFLVVSQYYELGLSIEQLLMGSFHDTSKPNAIFTLPASDWNGGFDVIDTVNRTTKRPDDSLQFLKEAYDVNIVMTRNETDLCRALLSVQSPAVVVISGHGTAQSLELSTDNSGVSTDFAKLDVSDANLSSCFDYIRAYRQTTVVMNACSNAKPVPRGLNLAQHVLNWSGASQVFANSEDGYFEIENLIPLRVRFIGMETGSQNSGRVFTRQTH